MATSTSNLGLQKPDYSDAADIAVLNGNSDKIDSSVNATDGAIAIVSNGNTHPQIPSGAYVYIRGHGSLSEGLYKNSTSGTLGVNQTLSTSNVSAISSGGMNEMKSITDTLNGKLPEIFTQTKTITTNTDGVVIFYDLSASSNAIISATIVRDGSAYNSWAGFIPGASGDGFLSLKMIDNGVNPVKSLPSTTAKVKLTILKLNNIPVAT